MASKLILKNEIREKYMALAKEFFSQTEEVLVVGSNELAIPCLDSEGNEEFITIKFSVPNGSRDGEAYDGYSMAQDFELKQKEKAEKVAQAKLKKEQKIAKDNAKREAKKLARENHLSNS